SVEISPDAFLLRNDFKAVTNFFNTPLAVQMPDCPLESRHELKKFKRRDFSRRFFIAQRF
ncbi:MAG: hypothetical protein IKG61_08885, partial [Selenomonadaceae bacterium]|nr:hypothetical protein [Selenomonadaceae bacterium]